MPEEPRTFLRVFLVSLKLGLTCFGGPVAHLGYFHREFVVRRRWIGEREYADLVALCQFLPGPASSQVNLAVGLLRARWAGACAAWLGFTLPSALLMIGFAYGVAEIGDVSHAGWLKGLKLAAVVMVAQAVGSMGRKFCVEFGAMGIAMMGAAAVLIAPMAWMPVAVIAVGAGVGWLLYRREALAPGDGPQAAFSISYGTRVGGIFLAGFAALFLVLPLLAGVTGSTVLASFDRFYRSGALVFGGGHVVLPLLRGEIVAPGWVTEDRFLAGYGAAQALPGPLFAFAAYLGAVMGGWGGGAVALAAIFLPSFLLVFGVLPFWDRLRWEAAAQAALRGTHAAVVGVLLAALYNPLWTGSVRGPRELGIVLAALGLLILAKLPPWAVVGFCALCGAAFLSA